jgi:nitrite reductase/ring-hydroxylating ferredoxin subunit
MSASRGAFDIRTGSALTAPCEVAIKTYAVTIDGGWVTVALEMGEA